MRQVGTTNVYLPQMGFGGASVGNLYRSSSDDAASATLQSALDAGISYFDTAPHYGHGLSEMRIGAFFGGRKPNGVVVSTKVGRVLEPSGPDGPPDHGFVDPLPFTQVFDDSYDGVMRSFEASFARLGGVAIDILLMHDLGEYTHGDQNTSHLYDALNGGFRAMADLKAAGDVKAIGLGVNECKICLNMLDHVEPDVFMLAGRYTLLERGAERHLLPACAERGVSVIAASPFNSGLLAKRPDETARYNYTQASDKVRQDALRLFDLIESTGGCLQAAALQFPLRNPVVVSVVNGMDRPNRVLSSVAWQSEKVSDEVWSLLEQNTQVEGAL